MQTLRSISDQSNTHIRDLSAPEDETDQLLSLINALGIIVPPRFGHNLEAQDFAAILTALEMQTERVREAIDLAGGAA